MKALVTGSSGFCGHHLTRYLKEQGVEVHALGHRDIQAPNYSYLKDVTDIEAMAAVMGRVKPDFVFHLAGVASAHDPTLFYRVNTQYAAGLLHALESTGLKDRPVLLVGTSAEYGKTSLRDLPIREDFPSHPYNHYGISKYAQTLAGVAASRQGHPVVIVRPFNIIGPRMPDYIAIQSFAYQIANILKGRKPARIEVGNLESSRDFIDIAQVVEIFWKLIRTPAAYGEVINVCSGKGTAMKEIAAKLISFSGLHIEIKVDPARFKPDDIPVHYGSIEKLRRFLGYTPYTDLDGVLKRVFEELRTRP